MTTYEREFEQFINGIVSKRVEEEINKLEVLVFSTPINDNNEIHVVLRHNGKNISTKSAIVVKTNG